MKAVLIGVLLCLPDVLCWSHRWAHDGTARSERPHLQLHANFQTEISSEISPAPRATEHKVIIETESHFLGTVPLQQPFLCEGVRGKGGGGGVRGGVRGLYRERNE